MNSATSSIDFVSIACVPLLGVIARFRVLRHRDLPFGKAGGTVKCVFRIWGSLFLHMASGADSSGFLHF